MFDFIDNALLPFLWIVIGMLLGIAAQRVIVAGSRKFQFTKSNDKMMTLFEELARVSNQKIIIQQQIAQCLEDVPLDRAAWYTTLQEQLHTIPAFVMVQIKNFGLAKPPPDTDDPIIEVTMEDTDGNVEEVFAPVTELDGWTGRAGGDR